MTPFEMWLASQVIAPDAYSRLVDSLRGHTGDQRAAREVRAIVGRVPKRLFLSWYRLDTTWSDLVEQGPEAYERLAASLTTTSERRVFRRALPRARAEAIVRATATVFMQTLAPSTAVAVADFRSAARDAAHDELEADRAAKTQELLTEGLAGLHQRIEANATFDERVALFPDPARSLLIDNRRDPTAGRLVDLVSGTEPKRALVALVTEIPAWLAGASAPTIVAAAELAAAYGVGLPP